MDCHKISIVVAFYKGNEFMGRLFSSINKVAEKMSGKAKFEVVLVNDSPETRVILPENAKTVVSVKLIINEKNLGTQKSRAKGISQSCGDWIIILDQDDELVVDGFDTQLSMTKEADVVVGNGLYQYGCEKKKIYPNKHIMEYSIQKKYFIRIRNLIPSPGECLIRKAVIPELWSESLLKQNGADDWLLWILLFQNRCRFCCNEKIVYIHNDANGKNLSLDLEKMYASAAEMNSILQKSLCKDEIKILQQAIEFKYLQDTKQLSLMDLWKYKRVILDNCFYKLNLCIKSFWCM